MKKFLDVLKNIFENLLRIALRNILKNFVEFILRHFLTYLLRRFPWIRPLEANEGDTGGATETMIR